MGAITETEPGGEIICIVGFSARPRGADNQPIPGSWRKFQIGERVRYITYSYKDTPADNPTGYLAVFEPIDHKDQARYTATQNYFVSLDCWEGLRQHFLSTQVAAIERDSVTDRGKKDIRDPMVATARKPPRIAGTISSNSGVAAQSPASRPRKLSRDKGLSKDR